MKKTIVIFLSMFYLVLSSGFTQYQHICKEMAVNLYSLTSTEHQNSDKPCPICTSKEKGLQNKKKDCCEHKTKIVKVDEPVTKQVNSETSVKFLGDAVPYNMLGAVFNFSIVETEKSTTYFSSTIPVRGNPLYILHCIYRI